MSKRLLPLIIILLVFLFRLPFLINVDHLNSDHAIFGLQAIEMIGGDYQWFLWECDYQAAWEALVASLYFRIFGSSFFVLQLVPLTAFFGCLALLFRILSPRIGAPKTFLFSLLWIFASRPLNEVTVVPYREWSVFFAMLGFALSLEIRPERKWLPAIVGFIPFFALFIDFFTIVFFVPLLVVGTMAAYRQKSLRLFGVGLLVGGAMLAYTRTLGPDEGAPLAFSIPTFLSHFPLLFGKCLPLVFGMPYDSFSLLGAFAYFLGCVAMIVGISQSVKEKSEIHLFGALSLLCTLGGFLGSTMASDIWSVRYLMPVLYCLPFMLYRFRGATAFIAPLVLLVGIGGWKQMKPLTDGIKVVRDPVGWQQGAKEVEKWLVAKEVHHAYSDYWNAYQLTFFYQKNIIVVPNDSKQDRYRPYRNAVEKSGRVARIFTSREPRPKKEEFLDSFQSGDFFVGILKR